MTARRRGERDDRYLRREHQRQRVWRRMARHEPGAPAGLADGSDEVPRIVDAERRPPVRVGDRCARQDATGGFRAERTRSAVAQEEPRQEQQGEHRSAQHAGKLTP